MDNVAEAAHRTIKRRADEPKLNLGDVVPLKDGTVGVVLARYIPSGEKGDDVHYIVELRYESSGGWPIIVGVMEQAKGG